MMGKTHLFVGLTAALAAAHPATAAECIPAVLGGAVGAVICDIDNLRNKGRNDSVLIQLTAAVTAACMLALDAWQKAGLCALSVSLGKERLIAGAAAFAVLWIIGFFSDHRGFTHSLAAGALFSQAVWMLCPPAALPFAAAYASHIAIDLLNRKGLRLLWPLKGGVRLGLCYSDRTADTLLFQAGILASAFLLTNSIVMHLF